MAHGISITESTTGARAILPASLAVIGLVATAPNATPDVKATLAIGTAGANNALTFTSKKAGTLGNAITVALVDPGENEAALDVTVDGDAIVVSLATGEDGNVTTTAAQLKAAIEGDADANALVAVANTGASSGAGVAAPLATTALSGGVDEPFPLDTPVLVAGRVDEAAGKAGDGGTLKAALEAIGDQSTPIVVVVRVAESAEDQDELVIGGTDGNTYTGLQALLAAESQVGVRPRIIGCPGLDTAEVVAEMVVVAQKLRGMAYAAAVGADVAAAVTYRESFSARELMLIWPDTNSGFAGDIVARAMGLRARIDEEQGWHKTISNVALNGVTGLAKDVHFDLLDSSTEAGVLNDAQVTTVIRQNGFRLWGNRTCANPETQPQWSFESAVRTSHALQDEIASIVAPFLDQPMTIGLIKDILETGNARFRQLAVEGRIVGAEMFFDQDENTPAELAAGRPHFRIQFTPAAPLENPRVKLVITDFYYTGFADLLV
jgi:Phage tail sheath protein FI